MNRRTFLTLAARSGAGAGAMALLPRLISAPAFAQGTGGYKALVCVYLGGGNDGNNTLIPTDRYYDDYLRGRQQLALSKDSLNPLRSTAGRTFGLHGAMSNTASIFNSGHASWIVNTGPLAKPTTKSQMLQDNSNAGDLFSHSSQAEEWQTGLSQAGSPTGWAGRVADLASMQSTSSLPMVISTSGFSLLGTGSRTAAVSTGNGNNSLSVLNALESLQPTMRQLESGTPVGQLQAEISAMQSDYLRTTKGLTAVLSAGNSIKTVFPKTPLGQQLFTIAKLINGREACGASRQVFQCAVGGYDTHAVQLDQQTANLTDLDNALSAFTSAMIEIGLFDQVTLFTMTDFARSLQTNATSGTDHAWGNHHLVVGGAVKGGQLYGQFPDLTLGGDNDLKDTGLWIPTTSASQYCATLCRWFGVSAGDTAAIFPELANFATPTLGFL